jgi:hypothetical protein
MPTIRRISKVVPIMAFLAISASLVAQDRGLDVVARKLTGDPAFDAGRQIAVIIGIDRYKEWPSLRSAASEAKAIRTALADRYVIDEFLELYDAEATATAIRRLFTETIPAKVGPHDSLLVFYAGHGYTDSTGTGFWIASDGSRDVLAQNNWIPNQQIRNMIGKIKAQRILILADACFSGDLLNVSRGAAPTIDSAYFRKALRLQARQVITSGSSESVPDDSEFGQQLLNILSRNDQAILDPVSMYERLRLGVSRTLPLFGSLPGNEEGASYVLFLKPIGGGMEASPPPAGATAPGPAVPTFQITRAYGSLSVAAVTGGTLYLDGNKLGEIPSGAKATIGSIEVGERRLEIRYAEGPAEKKTVTINDGKTTAVNFEWKKAEPKIQVPGSSPDMPLVLERRKVKIDGKAESWAGLSPVIEINDPTARFLGSPDFTQVRFYLCRDDDFLYWRIDYARKNPAIEPLSPEITSKLVESITITYANRSYYNAGVNVEPKGKGPKSFLNRQDQNTGLYEEVASSTTTAVVGASMVCGKVALSAIKKFITGTVLIRGSTATKGGGSMEFYDTYVDLLK